jgi:hypothetical protein
MKGRERPCSIRHRLKSSQNVLQRSVELAVKSAVLRIGRSLRYTPVSGRCQTLSACLKPAHEQSSKTGGLPTSRHPRYLRRHGINFRGGLKSKTRYDRN